MRDLIDRLLESTQPSITLPVRWEEWESPERWNTKKGHYTETFQVLFVGKFMVGRYMVTAKKVKVTFFERTSYHDHSVASEEEARAFLEAQIPKIFGQG